MTALTLFFFLAQSQALTRSKIPAEVKTIIGRNHHHIISALHRIDERRLENLVGSAFDLRSDLTAFCHGDATVGERS